MKVGITVRCDVCGRAKKPIGRSAPVMASYCDDDCRGYRAEPKPGSLWPNETEAEFGFKVGPEATEERP